MEFGFVVGGMHALNFRENRAGGIEHKNDEPVRKKTKLLHAKEAKEECRAAA